VGVRGGLSPVPLRGSDFYGGAKWTHSAPPLEVLPIWLTDGSFGSQVQKPTGFHWARLRSNPCAPRAFRMMPSVAGLG
jgi:hypothetical protein